MFEFIESKGLTNVVHTPEGVTCACPVCRQQGRDSTGNHLSIRRDGKFNCVVGSKNDPLHNRALYNLLYKGEDLELIFTPQEPKTKMVKVYDEAMLNKLVPDYRYWVGRGISEETLKLFGGGIAPETEKGKLAGRYCLPVRDNLNRLIGFTARLVRDDQFGPKWKHLMPSSLALWPYHLSKPAILEKSCIVILESPGDALKCYQMGIKNVLVMFGLNMSSKLAATLVGLNPQRIIISTNNDGQEGNGEAGNRAAAAIRGALLNFFDEDKVLIHLPKSKDWGVAQDAEFEALRRLIG